MPTSKTCDYCNPGPKSLSTCDNHYYRLCHGLPMDLSIRARAMRSWEIDEDLDGLPIGRIPAQIIAQWEDEKGQEHDDSIRHTRDRA